MNLNIHPQNIDIRGNNHLENNSGIYNGNHSFENNGKLVIKKETDRCAQWAFYLTFGVFIILGGIAIYKGDPSKLSNPVDPDGKTCGVDELQEYPSIYFPTPSKKYINRSVCVKTCPDLVTAPKLGQKLDCYPNSVVTSCEFKLQHGDKRDKEFLIYDTTLYNKNVCMPKNVKYFDLVTGAIKGNTWQQSLKSMRESATLTLSFTIVAIVLSILVKQGIKSSSCLPYMIIASKLMCILGFFFLGVLFAYRGFTIVYVEEENHKKIIEEDEVLTDIAQSNDSSLEINFAFAFICILIAIFSGLDWKNESKEEQTFQKMLKFSSKVMEEEGLLWVPIFFIFISFLLFIFSFIVQTNLQSIGEIDLIESKDLPFQRFTPYLSSKILSVILLISFFLIIFFIVHITKYIALALSYFCISMKIKGQEQIIPTGVWNEITEIAKYRIGTLSLSSFSFFLQPLRSCLERRQTKIDNEKYQLHEQSVQRIENKKLSLAERILGCLYCKCLKKCQNYGYLITQKQSKDFLEAGSEIQRKIDVTSEWYEQILDKGENFESNIRYSISLIAMVSLFLLCRILGQSLFNLTPQVLLIMASSILVSQLFIGTYQSVYAAIILYPLMNKQFNFNRMDVTGDNQSMQMFKDYINELVIERE